jgi:hypothetical protein
MHIVNFGLEWILFAILGWCVFKPPADKMLIMVIYVVIMIFWLVGFGYAQTNIR